MNTSIFTSSIITEYNLDAEVSGKTVIQSRIEKRIIECQLDLKDECDEKQEKG